ncbi:hypothetical protein ES703_54115 [subsurface metagenome]
MMLGLFLNRIYLDSAGNAIDQGIIFSIFIYFVSADADLPIPGYTLPET